MKLEATKDYYASRNTTFYAYGWLLNERQDSKDVIGIKILPHGDDRPLQVQSVSIFGKGGIQLLELAVSTYLYRRT